MFDSASASDKLLQYSGSVFLLIKLKDYYAPDTEVMKCLLVKQTKCTGFLFCEEVILGDILSQYMRSYDPGYGFNKTLKFN